MSKLIEALTKALHDDIEENGLGELYHITDLRERAFAYGVSAEPDEIAAAIRENRGVTLQFRGGHANVRVKLDGPDRQATLQPIDTEWYSLDTEAAVQAGLQRWFRQNGYLVKREVSDRAEVIAEIAESRSLVHVPDEPASRSTQRRDMMAHSQHSSTRTFHIVEVKGRTAAETDFYDTFGQIFPIDDPSVTRGWTIKKVPKHGLCFNYARRFVEAWTGPTEQPLVTLAVVVPDFLPWNHDPKTFRDRPTFYYPKQAESYARFLQMKDIAGDGVFPRLLRHLRDKYSLLEMADAKIGIAFRFWGYQGLNHVRDFATNQPVSLGVGGTDG